MTSLALALCVFVASHWLPARPAVRAACIRRFGFGPYIALYSVLSLAVLAWVIHAYGAAPYIELWPPAAATHGLAVAIMAPACLLVVAGLTSANPFSLGPGAGRFDPANPGIVGLCRHPVLWGLVLWAVAHGLANGDAASLLMFGAFAGLGLAGPGLLDKKRRAALGPDTWQSLARAVRSAPLAVILAGIGAARLLAGLALYGVLLALHGALIGVSPLTFLQI